MDCIENCVCPPLVSGRAPDGNIVLHEEPVNAALYRGPISKIPFVRGLTMLWDARDWACAA